MRWEVLCTQSVLFVHKAKMLSPTKMQILLSQREPTSWTRAQVHRCSWGLNSSSGPSLFVGGERGQLAPLTPPEISHTYFPWHKKQNTLQSTLGTMTIKTKHFRLGNSETWHKKEGKKNYYVVFTFQSLYHTNLVLYFFYLMSNLPLLSLIVSLHFF